MTHFTFKAVNWDQLLDGDIVTFVFKRNEDLKVYVGEVLGNQLINSGLSGPVRYVNNDAIETLSVVRPTPVRRLPTVSGVYEVTSAAGNTYVATLTLPGGVETWQRLTSRGPSSMPMSTLQSARSINRISGF